MKVYQTEDVAIQAEGRMLLNKKGKTIFFWQEKINAEYNVDLENRESEKEVKYFSAVLLSGKLILFLYAPLLVDVRVV